MDALLPSPATLLQLALETGAIGPVVRDALVRIEDSEPEIRAALQLLEGAEPTAAAELIASRLATPTRLGLLLREQPIDWEAADTVIAQLGTAAARPLIEQLIGCDSRALRRALMDRLGRIGPGIGPEVLEHLADERWHVVRNMAVLLREAGCPVDPVVGERLAMHPEPRVRREALLLRLELPAVRERALSDALRDPDKHVIRAALQAAGTHLPGSGVLVLARRLQETGFPAELRVAALLLLGRSHAPAALEALLHTVDGGRTLLGRAQLAPTTPELLAALAGLARCWPDEPRARDYLRLAARSPDPEIRSATRPLAIREAR